jgi:hypothetical protein
MFKFILYTIYNQARGKGGSMWGGSYNYGEAPPAYAKRAYISMMPVFGTTILYMSLHAIPIVNDLCKDGLIRLSFLSSLYLLIWFLLRRKYTKEKVEDIVYNCGSKKSIWSSRFAMLFFCLAWAAFFCLLINQLISS